LPGPSQVSSIEKDIDGEGDQMVRRLERGRVRLLENEKYEEFSPRS
jgi:hypothetical protein